MSKSDLPFQLLSVTPADNGKTLAAFLKQKQQCTWGEAKKLVGRRCLQINGNLCVDPSRRLTERDVVKIWKESLPKPVDASAVKVVHVDDDLVVIEKPPRVTSARHFEERRMSGKRRQLQPTVEELLPLALAAHIRRQRRRERLEKKFGSFNFDLNKSHSSHEDERIQAYARKLPVIAVHRLDRDTSGLMLFARNQKTAVRLGKLFKNHTIDRRYLAVIQGRIEQQTFESYLVRDRGDGHRGSAQLPIPPDAQLAVTHVRPVETIGGFTILECKLETGRTHQIRIHLAEAGFPLCGDPIYRRALDGRIIADTSQAPRQALHSYALRFVHPTTGQVLKFLSSLPADLKKWLS